MSKILDIQDGNLDHDNQFVDMDKLRALTWTGIPQTEPRFRCEAWKLLLDYIPIDRGFKDEMLKRKREEYQEIVRKYFGDFSNENVLSAAGNNNSDENGIHMSEFERKNFR